MKPTKLYSAAQDVLRTPTTTEKKLVSKAILELDRKNNFMSSDGFVYLLGSLFLFLVAWWKEHCNSPLLLIPLVFFLCAITDFVDFLRYRILSKSLRSGKFEVTKGKINSIYSHSESCFSICALLDNSEEVNFIFDSHKHDIPFVPDGIQDFLLIIANHRTIVLFPSPSGHIFVSDEITDMTMPYCDPKE